MKHNHEDGDAVLTINGGSSSIKFALFSEVGETPEPRRLLVGQIERIGIAGTRLKLLSEGVQFDQSLPIGDASAAMHAIADWFDSQRPAVSFSAVVHRIVHGGSAYWRPQRIDDDLLFGLRKLEKIDPAHLPGEIALIDIVSRRYPGMSQIVCFDTAFHHELPDVAKILPIPRSYEQLGYRKFGFHGLSYQYLMKQLAKLDGGEAKGRVVLAHLGSGASLAAVKNGQSIDTTMSYTSTAGLVMGTRSGDLDPGLLVALMRNENKSVEEIDTMINKQSGLKGISESSSDIRDLLACRDDDPRAAEAIAVFCYQCRKHIGAMTAALGGLDTLVFSGGIGEHASTIRAEICQELKFLSLELDPAANATHASLISTGASLATVRVIPTDEESTLADAAFGVLRRA